MAINRVRKILSEVQALNGLDKVSFINGLPKVILQVPRTRFTNKQIEALAHLARKHEGTAFDSLAQARQYLRHL